MTHKIPDSQEVTANEFKVKGFKISVIRKPEIEAAGYTKFVRLDGKAIGTFIQSLKDAGRMEKLSSTLREPQQVWVCLSSKEGHADADCRCTVCIERTPDHDFSGFANDELFTLKVPESAWAMFEVGAEQSPSELHSLNVYKLVGDIGYTFNRKIGLHFDNEHEWEPGKTMQFLLPVIAAEE